jgi:hypothetical protein
MGYRQVKSKGRLRNIKIYAPVCGGKQFILWDFQIGLVEGKQHEYSFDQ